MIFWDGKAKRYRDENGKFISSESVRANIERLLLETDKRAKSLAEDLGAGRITIAEWQVEMRKLLSGAHTLAGAVGKGGRGQMTQADWGAIGGRLASEFRYLNRFAELIQSGAIQTVDAIVQRAGLYVNAVRVTFTKNELASAKESDTLTEAKRTLHARESCPGCLAVADVWLAIEDMPAIGTLDCGQYCRCTMSFRATPNGGSSTATDA